MFKMTITLFFFFLRNHALWKGDTSLGCDFLLHSHSFAFLFPHSFSLSNLYTFLPPPLSSGVSKHGKCTVWSSKCCRRAKMINGEVSSLEEKGSLAPNWKVLRIWQHHYFHSRTVETSAWDNKFLVSWVCLWLDRTVRPAQQMCTSVAQWGSRWLSQDVFHQ